MFYSDDDGRTWRRNRNGELFIIIEPWRADGGDIGLTVTEVQPGNLLMVMRTRVGHTFRLGRTTMERRGPGRSQPS